MAPGTGATAYYQYVYDPEGNLIATTTRTSAGCDLNIAPWQNFVVDQYGNQITELDAAGNWKHTNVFANGELLATYSPTGVHFAMGDWQGSKRVQASAAGAIEDTCWNLPFNDGLGCSASSGTDATEHHYTGKEYDPFTGLDLFGARDFTKYSGRFISPDWSVKPEDIPYADLENPQSLNLYAYVRNNPLTNVDADGHYIPFQQQWPTTGWGSSGTLQMIASFTSSITGSMFADLAQQQTAQQQAAQIPGAVKSAIMNSVNASNAPSGADTTGGFHEESGIAGTNAAGGLVVSPDQPGAYSNPDTSNHVSTTHTPVDADARNSIANVTVMWHVHPSGTTATHGWVQPPSAQDQSVVVPGPINIVVGAGNRTVYFYNGSSNVQSMSLKNFMKP